MKFKKYIKESAERKLNLYEGFENPDRMFNDYHPADDVYGDIKKAIADKRYDDARNMIKDLEQEVAEIESSNAKKKFFKFPKFLIDSQKRAIDTFLSQLPVQESIEDMDRRCEQCNTLLADNGTCPKCDEGEEDYGDKALEEELSNKEKLLRAFPELNFDKTPDEMNEDVKTEELTVREKLKRAYPELNFDTPVTEACEVKEELSNREKLLKAFPELNFDKAVTEEIDPEESSWEDYDDDYEFEDDVEMDRRHAALYGGDRMYCDCGAKLSMDEYGSFCPRCNPKDPEEVYEDTPSYDDEI